MTSNALFNHGKNHYGRVILNPGTLAQIACSQETWKEIMSFHHLLATDEYVQYVDALYRESLRRFGSNWWYLDITSVVYTAAKVIQPRNYLEIGVRRGRSACAAVRGNSQLDIMAFDLWIADYAGMENPGQEFVRSELIKHGHNGQVTFVDGDSHQTVPALFKQNPNLTFDLITVDGDHSEQGALNDLRNTIPHLSVGGIIVFDDISHPAHPYMLDVWLKAKQEFPYLATYEYGETGYGVAFGIRRI